MGSQPIIHKLVFEYGEIDADRIIAEVDYQLDDTTKLEEWREFLRYAIDTEIGKYRRARVTDRSFKGIVPGSSKKRTTSSKTQRKSIRDQYLNKAVHVPNLGRVIRYRDLTPEHCDSIAQQRFNLAFRNLAWGEYYELQARVLRKEDVTTMNELSDEAISDLVESQPNEESS